MSKLKWKRCHGGWSAKGKYGTYYVVRPDLVSYTYKPDDVTLPFCEDEFSDVCDTGDRNKNFRDAKYWCQEHEDEVK